MGYPSRRPLRRALAFTAAALAVTALLVKGVDSGAAILGPIVIVFGGLAGTLVLRVWWANLNERWFAAEFVLVAASWALFAAAFAGIQFLVFSFVPGAFLVDSDYGHVVGPRYRAEWARDSGAAGSAAGSYQLAASAAARGPAKFWADSVYLLPDGTRLSIRESCNDLWIEEECVQQLSLQGAGLDLTLDLVGEPGGRGAVLTRDTLLSRLATRATELRDQAAALGAKLADPARHVEPRIGDFLYETAIAFSGRDSGIFAPIGAAARFFKVLESLASYLLFGIVVSRVAIAAVGPER